MSENPTVADDTLQSFQKVEIVDLLCEGPIEGIEGGEKGVYLDLTPLQDSTGATNFEGCSIKKRTGTQDQTYIPQTNNIGSQRATPLNLELLKSTPRTRSINDATTDRIRLTFTLPSLLKQEDDGDIVGNQVKITIQTKYQGDSDYADARSITISGKSSSTYQRACLIELSGNFPVSIRVKRNTADNGGDTRNQNTIRWTSITEITDEKLSYPNAALCYLKFDSRNFSGIPKRRYLVKGLKINIPTGVTVDSTTGRIIYPDGFIWDGNFQSSLKWCSDPAWALWDLITNTRYGASIPESSLDRWDFLTVSKYCNELVSDKKGGLEPRFSLNLYLHTRNEVFNTINDISSAFRGMSYYSSGSLVLTQDKEGESQYVLNPSNVIDGIFNFSGSSKLTRHTTATIAWQDYDLLGDIQQEYVEDVEGISKYGINNRQTKAIGCYSQGQAHRLGKWLLKSEQLLTETVTFGVAINSGIVLAPGMIISIADPVRTGQRRGGRISSVQSRTVFHVDSNTDFNLIDNNNDPKCSVILPSGLTEEKDCDVNGTQIILSSALSETPQVEGVWMIRTNDVIYKKYKVVRVEEADQIKYNVTALMYNESIYGNVDADELITIPNTTNLTAVPLSVTNIGGTEHLYTDGLNVKTAFELSWTYPTESIVNNKVSIPIPPSLYNVNYQLAEDNYIQLTTTSPSVRIENLRAGTLRVEIQAINNLGLGSPIATSSFVLEGKTASPEDVTGLTFEDISPNSGRLKWTQTTSLDVKVAGKVHIRHSSLTDGTGTWNNSVDLIDAIAGSSTEVIIPKLTGETLVKFADDLGNFSVNASSFIIQTPSQKAETLLVKNQREDQSSPPFTNGTKTNTEYDATLEALQLTSSGGNINSTGSYTFAPISGSNSATLDLEGVFALNLQRHFATRAIRPTDLIDVWPDVNARSDWDGAIIDSVNASFSIRTTTDNPSSSPTWSNWISLTNGTFSGRGFQFKTDLTSGDTTENILIDELGYEATFDQRTECSTEKDDSGEGEKTITFTKPFWTGTSLLGGSTTKYLPNIYINVHNLTSGDYIDMGAITASNFKFTVKNSSGAAIDKEFTWTAVGYGRGA